MNNQRSVLDGICRGVAEDVHRAHQARGLLEEIDTVVAIVIETHAANVPIINREDVLNFLARGGVARARLLPLSNEKLSGVLLGYLESYLPRADSASDRPLNRALGHLTAVRDKAIAHHDRVDSASLLVPGWPHLVELIGIADEAVTLLASAYLSVNFSIADDASWTAASLRSLLRQTGLRGGAQAEPGTTEASESFDTK